ncbi:phage baseplate assembly protein V [Lactobacillus crispatus]|uniref:phage baseplate assembly protein V n=1 Tax=Lactobacillus crispatus TaxID=47770 RepID=UPI0029C36CB3|nr:phage baseplate assembly protein V [Lactobacillus crispatus]MDX5091601.1 phage baseplate assembly protein V [Lactobacillus crispatus]
MDPLLKNLVRVGIVSSVDYQKGTAKVAFEDRDDMVSPDLQILGKNSYSNKDYWLPEPEEQVLCLFLPNGNAQGFILGSLYNDEDKLPIKNKNKRHVRFGDGTFIDYDRETHTLTIDFLLPGKIVINNAEVIRNPTTQRGEPEWRSSEVLET